MRQQRNWGHLEFQHGWEKYSAEGFTHFILEVLRIAITPIAPTFAVTKANYDS